MTNPAMKVLSAGIVPVYLAGPEPRYLLLRAYAYWDFPKGEVEQGEDPRKTAVRELAEETGLVHPDFRWGGGYTETPVYARGKIARYYLAAVGKDEVVLGVSSELGRPEHHEYRWLSCQGALGLLNPRVAEVLRWAHARVSGTG